MKKVIAEALNPNNGAVSYLGQLKEMSRKNRNSQTLAEQIIWNKLLKGKRLGYTFLRQKPIGRFILDFYCSELCLAIEIDGEYHKDRVGYDMERDEFLKQIGIETIRFTNETVLKDFGKVKSVLLSLVKGRRGEAEKD